MEHRPVSDMSTTDRYQQLTQTPPGKFLRGRLGLPESTPLRRHEPGDPVLHGPALVGGAPGGRLAKPLAAALRAASVKTIKSLDADDAQAAALIFDATGITRSEDLGGLHDFFSPAIAAVQASGRLIVLGTPPERAADRRQAVAQRALEGFTRSAAKELRHSATGQLVYVAPGAEGNLDGTLRFLLSGRSAYVSGQVIRIGAGASQAPGDWDRPLDGRVAAVTGASRGMAPRSPRSSRATAPMWWPLTSRPRARRWPRWPTRSGGPPW